MQIDQGCETDEVYPPPRVQFDASLAPPGGICIVATRPGKFSGCIMESVSAKRSKSSSSLPSVPLKILSIHGKLLTFSQIFLQVGIRAASRASGHHVTLSSLQASLDWRLMWNRSGRRERRACEPRRDETRLGFN